MTMPSNPNHPCKLYNELAVFFKTLDVNPSSAPISILTGVSGGADSVALMHLLHIYSENLGIKRLAAAHVNHGLRGEESDGDEEFVRGISADLKIEFFATRLDGALADDNKDGVEDWARNERYKFFQDIKAREGFDYIATAHTANDQAETLILRLMRGTGVRGLRGIHDRRKDGVIRPLLGIERLQLEEWIDERGLPYRTDSSNSDTKFRRNFVRSEIIPLMLKHNDRAISGIAACAASAARVWDIVAEKIDMWADNYAIRVNDTVFHIEKAGLSDGLIAPEALVTLFDEYDISVSRHHINRVMSAINLTSGEYLLPGGWKFYPRDNRICFVKDNG
jgi:tRNA(Ile)-lysidine synthase